MRHTFPWVCHFCCCPWSLLGTQPAYVWPLPYLLTVRARTALITDICAPIRLMTRLLQYAQVFSNAEPPSVLPMHGNSRALLSICSHWAVTSTVDWLTCLSWNQCLARKYLEKPKNQQLSLSPFPADSYLIQKCWHWLKCKVSPVKVPGCWSQLVLDFHYSVYCKQSCVQNFYHSNFKEPSLFLLIAPGSKEMLSSTWSEQNSSFAFRLAPIAWGKAAKDLGSSKTFLEKRISLKKSPY